jgi:hypothetical protein
MIVLFKYIKIQVSNFVLDTSSKYTYDPERELLNS